MTQENSNSVPSQEQSFEDDKTYIISGLVNTSALNEYGTYSKEVAEKILSYGETGELASFICSLDLSDKGDLIKLIEIVKILDKKAVVKKVLRKDGSDLFDNILIGDHLLTPLELTSILESLDSLSLYERQDIDAHMLVKLSTENLTYWSAPFGQQSMLQIFKDASPENSNMLLSYLITSAEIASQALNRYDTGYFIGLILARARELDISVENLYNHPNWPMVSDLIREQGTMFGVWNEVFLKYLSNIIQEPNYIFQVESVALMPDELLGEVNYATSKHYYIPGVSVQNEIENNIKNNIFNLEIEEEVKELIKKIKVFQNVLNDLDRKMSYAKPQNSETV